jgi:hypothetical protein
MAFSRTRVMHTGASGAREGAPRRHDRAAMAARVGSCSPHEESARTAAGLATREEVDRIVLEAAPNDFRFAAAATEYAETLRRSKRSEGARFDEVLGILASTAQGHTDRLELERLARTAKGSFR